MTTPEAAGRSASPRASAGELRPRRSRRAPRPRDLRAGAGREPALRPGAAGRAPGAAGPGGPAAGLRAAPRCRAPPAGTPRLRPGGFPRASSPTSRPRRALLRGAAGRPAGPLRPDRRRTSRPRARPSLDSAAIPPVHPASPPRRVLPDFSFAGAPALAAALPGGPDLHRQIAADHPARQRLRARARAASRAGRPVEGRRDEAQESFSRTGRLSRAPGERRVSATTTS